MSEIRATPAQDSALPDDLQALKTRLRDVTDRCAVQDGELAALDAALKDARLTAHDRETRILEAQVEIRILEDARDAAHARLETARAEVLTLTRLLAQSEPRAGGDLAPETFARTLDRQAQQLEAQTREMAELTRLLAASEHQTRALRKAKDRMIAWLPELMEALLQGAGAADPAAEGARLEDTDYADCARRLIATGAFDPEHYLTTNPDVAESGTDPAWHFVKYGLTEGRAPRDLTQPRTPPTPPAPEAATGEAREDPDRDLDLDLNGDGDAAAAPDADAQTEIGAKAESEADTGETVMDGIPPAAETGAETRTEAPPAEVAPASDGEPSAETDTAPPAPDLTPDHGPDHVQNHDPEAPAQAPETPPVPAALDDPAGSDGPRPTPAAEAEAEAETEAPSSEPRQSESGHGPS